MPTRCATIVIAILAGVPVAAAERPTPKEFLESWAAAFLSSDIEQMVAFYDDSHEVLAVESRGNVRKGPAEIRQMYREAFDEVVFESVEVKPLVVRQQDSVAWCTCRFMAKTRLRADGSRWILEVRSTLVIRQHKDSWVIALEHFSPILDVPRVRRSE